MSLRTAIIGGGISGLASAHRIAAMGHQVTVFEGESFLGGLGTTFPYRDGHLERFYHCILPNDDALLARIHELGLGSELLWRPTKMGFMYRRDIHPLNTPIDLLRFSPLTLIERLRMGLLAIRARSHGLSPELDDITAADWIRGMVGDRAFEILWRPLLAAKIGDHYPALPALWLSSRMNREKNTKTEVKGCLTRGYRSLIEAFERSLLARGAQFRMSTRVRAIERDGEGMALRLEDGRIESFDTVVCTSPLVQFQRMTGSLGLDPALAELKLDYQGVVSGVFVLEKPLTHYYWMPWVDSDATAQGAIEMSNLVPLDRSHGGYVTYLVNYTHRDGPLYAESDDALLARYRTDLAALFPGSEQTIREQFLFRAPFVEPMWTTGYAKVVPPTSVIPGRLYLACTAQVYPNVNSWNSCCEVVDRMLPAFEAETGALPASRSACA